MRSKELEHQAGRTARSVATPELQTKQKLAVPEEPPSLDFAVEFPPISALDYDVLKLTALYTARNGRQFLLHLSQREARNPQFEFLKPNNSLHPLFLRLVDQYGRIITPSRALLERLDILARDRDVVLNSAMGRLQWTRSVRERRLRAEEIAEKDRLAFESIDWHDFVVAESIDFTDADRAILLPRPLEKETLQSMNIVQRRQLWNDGSMLGAVNGRPAPLAGEDDMEIEGGHAVPSERLPSTKRVNVGPEISSPAGIQVRHDYLPRAEALNVTNTPLHFEICPICGRAIPKAEISEHIRIESLDPKWKEQKDRHLSKHTSTNLVTSGDEVTRNLNDMTRVRRELSGLASDEANRRVVDASRYAASQAVQWDGRSDPASVGQATKEAMSKAKAVYQQQMQQMQRDGSTQDSSTGQAK